MIIVTGSVTAREADFAALRQEALDHVARSRREPGCLLHSVHVDCEDPLRLVFIEHWANRSALETHFKHSDTAKIMRAIASLAAEKGRMEIFEATPVS